VKKSGFSKAQVVRTIKELEAGTPATELGCTRNPREHDSALEYKCAGLETSDLARLKHFEVGLADAEHNCEAKNRARRRSRVNLKKWLGLTAQRSG